MENLVKCLPESYVVPKVWSNTNAPSAMNQPTAGARTEKALSKGEHPIQLYSLGTPNGQKVTILLEELGVEYDAWTINIMKLDQFTTGFVEVNPNSKIPAMVDYSGEKPLRLFESVSMMIYLAEKYKKFLPTDVAAKAECMNWLIWQVGTAPYLGGGFGHFYHYCPIKIEYAIDRFTMETKRILSVLDKQLEGKDYICGADYTIADMAIFPWIRCIETGYKAKEFVELDSYKNVARWVNGLMERPAVKRGLRVNGFGPDAVQERHSPKDFDASV